MNDNNSSSPSNTTVSRCIDSIPSSNYVFQMQSSGAKVGLAFAILLSAAVLALYVEQFIFIYRHFVGYLRRSHTMVVIGIYPVFSVTSLLGFMVPRAGTLVDFVANIYLSICMLYLLRLVLDYFGGAKRAWTLLEGAEISLRAPPLCCCLVCLPKLIFNKAMWFKLHLLVMQVAFIRPCLMFIAAVLWVDGAYTPGLIAADNAYIYIWVINIVSSMSAVYALNVLKNTFNETLKDFNVGGKVLSLQLVIILSVVFNLIINILVQNDVIVCDELFPSKARGERIFHLSMICLMVPLSFLGRYNYRRASDGVAVAGCKQPLLINDTVDVSLIEKGQISDDDINPIKENEASQDQAETFVTPLDTNSNVKS